MAIKLSKKQIWHGGSYIVFMLLFFFIGIPQVKLLDGFIGAVVLTVVYEFMFEFVWGIYEGSKKQ